MKTLVIFNHPYEGSYCNAILTACKKGLSQAHKETDVINLDKDGFNPVMSEQELKAFAIAHNNPREAFSMLSPQVLDYQERLQQAEHIVFIFPIWWMLMPALTKGFIDKTFFPGIAFNYDSSGNMKGLLHYIKQVTVITTMAMPGFYYETKMGNAVWKALLHGTFESVGLNNCKWINIDDIKNLTDAERVERLQDIEDYFAGVTAL